MDKRASSFRVCVMAVLGVAMAVLIPVFLGHAQTTATFYTDGTNFGIGTIAPTQKLQVTGTVSATSFSGDASSVTGLSAAWTDGGTNVYPSLTTDNVGIGTTAPNAATFEVIKNSADPVLKISSNAGGNGDFLMMNSRGNVGIGTTVFVGGMAMMKGNIGIGTLTPVNRLSIYDDAGTGSFRTLLKLMANGGGNTQITGADDVASLYPKFIFYRSRGTLAAKAVVASSNYLMSSFYMGYDGSTQRPADCITFEVDAAASAGDMPTRIELHTQLDGAATALEGNTPRVVIKNNGLVGIGTANPVGGLVTVNGNAGIGTWNASNKLSVIGNIGVGTTRPYREIGASLNGMVIEGNLGIGTWDPTEKLQVVGNLLVQGSTSCTLGNGAGATLCSSDMRLKENIKEIQQPLEKISTLRGVEFDWNAKAVKPGRHDIGVIAQDVAKVFPTAVVDDADGYQMLDYAVLVAPLIEAVRQLKGQADAQKKITILQEGDLAQLKKANKRFENDLAQIKILLCEDVVNDPFCAN